MPLNGSASGTISSSSQIDKWTVTTNADGNLTVTLANSGTSDFYAELLANDGITALSTVIRVNSSNANSASITASGLAPGSFIFEVYPVGTSTGSYTVSNSLATPSQGTDKEPNDYAFEPLTLPLNGSAGGQLGYNNYFNYTDAADWYKVTTTSNGKLQVRLQTNVGTFSANSDFYLYVYAGDTTTLLSNVIRINSGNANLDSVNIDGLAPGSYYVKITPVGTSYFGTYILSDTFFTPSQVTDKEPNDYAFEPLTLPLNGSAGGQLGYNNYVNYNDPADWYKVTTTANGKLQVRLQTNVGTYSSNGDFYLYVYAGDTTTLLSNVIRINSSNANLDSVNIDGLAPGNYYIKIAPVGSSYFGTYIVSNTFFTPSQGSDKEPNDYAFEPLTLPLNGSAGGQLGYNNYVNYNDPADWYKVTTIANGKLQVRLQTNVGTYASHADFYLYVYAADTLTSLGSVIRINSNNSNLDSVNIDGLAPGNYYIKITPVGSSYFGTYIVSDTFFIPSQGSDKEPNNYAIQSDTLPLYGTAGGQIGYNNYYNYSDQTDWYKVVTTSTGRLRILIQTNVGTYSSTADLYLYVFAADTVTSLAGVIRINNNNSNLDSVVISGLAAGTYYIRVVPVGTGYFGTYLLSANHLNVLIDSTQHNICLNTTAPALTATVTQGDGSALSYQWYSNTQASKTGGTLISGATLASYTPPTSTAGTTYYYCRVSDADGDQGTSNVSGAFVVGASVSGSISGAGAVCTGTNSTTLTLSGYTGTIQWQSSTDNTNFNNIAGAANPTYTATNLTQTSYYRVVVTNGACSSVISASVTINVSPAAIAGSISGAGTVCSGTNSTTLTLAGYTGTIQWQSSTDNVNFANVGGAINTTYTAANLTQTTYYQAVVTSGSCGSAKTASVAVTVTPVSVAGSISGAATVCSGANSTTLTLSGYTGSIQWQSSTDNTNFSGISGAVNATYTATNLTQTTYYRVVVTSGSCTSATSSSVAITVGQGASAGAISGAATVCPGTNSTTLTLSGYSGSIQWQSSSDNVNFANITGAVNPTYTATNLTQTTYYQAVVTSGSCGSATTTSVAISVTPASVSGSISGAATVCTGANSTTLTLSGYTGAIQWQSSSDNVNFANIGGANSTTYTATNLTQTTYYRVVVTSGSCSAATSSSVAITIGQGASAGTISGAATVCSGSNSTTLTLSGYSGSIQWQSSGDNVNFANITGAVNPTYTATNLTQTTYYQAVVTSGSCGSATTTSVAISVTPASVSGSISGAATVCSGANSTTLTLTGYAGAIQWQSSTDNTNFSSISGAVNATYTATNLTQTTYYRVVVTSGSCSAATSSSVAITVGQGASAGTISGAGAVCAGTNSTTLTLSGYSGSIQWQSSSDNVNFANIGGANGATYTATNLNQTTYYQAVVSGSSCGTATSASVAVTVTPASVSGSISGAATVCSGANSTTLSLSGYTGAIQWQSSTDNTNFSSISGAVNATYTATNLTQTTYYRVVVTSGSCTSATSSSVAITVGQGASAGAISGAATVCPGTNSTTLTLSGYSGSIQWQSSSDNVNFANIPGANGATYTATNLTQTTYYQAVVSGSSCGSATSTSVAINIVVVPTPSLTSSANSSVCAGTSVTYTTQSGQLAGSYIWSFTGTAASDYNILSGGTASDYTVTVQWLTSGVKTVTVGYQNTGGCAVAAPASVSTTVASSLISFTVTGGGSFCAGGTGVSIGLSGSQSGVNYQLLLNGSITGSPVAGTGNALVFGTVTAAGTYTVTATNTSAGCSGVMLGDAVVSVNTLPIATITSLSSVCGSTTGNTATVPDAGNGAAYLWTISNGTITAGSGTSMITYTSGVSGTVTLSVVVTNSSNCSASSGNLVIPIVASPTVLITTASSVCANSTNNIASVDNAGNGATYTWSITNGTITAGNGTNSITYSAGSSGVIAISVTVSYSTGCSQSTADVSVNIGSGTSATITAPSAVCSFSSGNTASVANAGNDAVYTWTIWNGIITSGNGTNSITYSVGFFGEVKLSVVISNISGCSAATGSTTIDINQVPFTPLCDRDFVRCGSGHIELEIYTEPGVTIDWYSAPRGGALLQAGTLSGLNRFITPVLTNGITLYYAQARNLSTGCTSWYRTPVKAIIDRHCNRFWHDAPEKTVDGKTINEGDLLTGLDAKAWPNPSQQEFNLVISSSSLEVADIKVFDMMGRVVAQKRATPGQVLQFGATLTTGSYIVEILQGSDRKLLKVVKN